MGRRDGRRDELRDELRDERRDGGHVTGADLTTTLAGARLPTPLLTASGCAGTGRELEPFLDLAGLGGFVTRTITLDPRSGAAGPRIAETASGVLHATGLPGPGVNGFLATELPWLAQRGVRTVVSIAAATLGEYAELARRIGTSPGVTGVEVNLSWPEDGRTSRPYHAAKAVAVVRRDVPRGVPVLVKLPADGAVVDLARAVAEAGADGVVVVHGVPGMAIDPRTLRPLLGADGAGGWLSGPAVHAVALRCVFAVHAALPDLPVVGVGGVRSGRDALAMLAAGASAVQVGTAVLTDPSAPQRILAGLTDELAARNIPAVADLIGRAHREEEEQS
jgi:dihydroorotate dehydrogenase (NAD+) catalytic subunit